MKRFKILKAFDENQVDDIVEIEIDSENEALIGEKVSEGCIEELVEEQKDINEEIESKVEEIVNKKIEDLEKSTKKEKNIMETIEVKERALSPEKKLHNSFIAAKALATGKWDGVAEEVKTIVGQNTVVGDDGGVLVDPTVTADINRYAMDTAVIAPKCRQVPIGAGSDSMKVRQLDGNTATPANYLGISLGVIAQGAEIPRETVTFKSVNYDVNSLKALIPVGTNEILEDVPGLASYISGIVGEAFGLKVDDEILSGADALYTALVGHASTAKVTVSATPTAAQIRAMYVANLFPGRAEWYVSNAAYEALMGVKDGDNLLLQPNYNVSPFGTILGRPVTIVPAMVNLSANGGILFGDFGATYAIGYKNGIRMDSSIHLLFDVDMTAWRFVLRTAGGPVMRSTVTNKAGKVMSAMVQSIA
jgi:HK97 family phage major capsid protein